LNIAIFGASGATGNLLTERCLAKHDHVTALLRTPEKFLLRDHVRVIQGSPFDLASVRQTKPVRRIIVLGSAGALADSLDKQPAWRRWIVQNVVYNTFLKHPVASQISQWNNISRSNLDWTMVMPPMLTNARGHGTFRVDGEALPRNGSRISREDVADFMMQQIDNPQWIGKGVYISW
jgi:putative NADH-flavin reductase